MAAPPPTDRPGDAHQARLAARGRRKELGAFYTPPALVAGVLDLALDPVLARAGELGPDAVAALRVVDPACGDGRFLVAAGERITAALVGLGVAADEARRRTAERCLHGIDIDPAAVRLARAAVRAVGGGASARSVARRVVVGDALVDDGLLPPGTFDVVVGNPPFLSQLGARTARPADASAALRRRFGDAVGAYTDPAAAFLLLGLELARPDGGGVALVEPVSLLTARDAGGARAAALERAGLVDLWVVGDAGFDAAVEVCVPHLVRGASGGASRTRLHEGPGCVPGGDAATPSGRGSWSALLAALDDLPTATPSTSGTLAELADATADFRDQYYGLAPHVVDRADADDRTHPPLVTVGLVDPAHLRWGERPTRFNKVRFVHPRVVLDDLPSPLRSWADARLVPKVLLATQTRIPEAVADPAGRLLPSVPMISIVPHDPADVWRVAALLTCPATALVAVRRHLGSGRNARALRLRASEALELPLPADRAAWDTAAEALAAGAPLAEVGRAMDVAFGVDPDGDLLAWWLDLLPSG